MPISWNGTALAMTEPIIALTMQLLSQPLDGRSGVSHRAWSPAYTPWTGDHFQVSHKVRHGSQNETIFPHSGGEERRKKREKL
jgi:hypothetical protein